MSILLFTFFILLLLTSCRDKAEITNQEIERNLGPDEVIDHITMISTNGGEVEWEMKAFRVYRYSSEKRFIAYDVTLETINTEDKNFYRSDSVFVYEMQDEFIGMGNVEIISPRGILHTQKIIWYRIDDRIKAPDEFYLKRDDHEIWGKNLVTNSSLDYIDMTGVSGKGKVEVDGEF